MKHSLSHENEPHYSSVSAGIHVLNSDARPIALWIICLLSALLHVLLAGTLGLAFIILQFLGFNIPLFEPLALKQRDIEFVLVENPTAPPRDKNTRNRAEHATRSGGEKVKNLAQAEPQKSAGNPAPRQQPKPPQPQAQPKPQPKPQPTRPVTRQAPQPTPQPQPTPPQPQQVASAAPPSPKLPTPKTPSNNAPIVPPNPIAPNIKTPEAPAPKTLASGPVMNAPGMGSGKSASGSSGGPVGPSQIPGGVSSASASSASPGGTHSSGGKGGRNMSDQMGSPGGGGGRPGIDALPEPDFGPYISELQRRIKRNWTPPSDEQDKRIVAMFTIGKDGRLLSLRIQTSSGVKIADDAALNAIRASAPFRSLPPNFRGNDIDVQFIFDYNVYRGKSSGISYH